MRNSEEWEKVLNQLTENNKPKSNVTVGNIIAALISLASISAFGGMAIMLLNMVINEAWPNLTLFQPGIGYRHGAAIFALWLVWFGFKNVITNASNKGDD